MERPALLAANFPRPAYPALQVRIVCKQDARFQLLTASTIRALRQPKALRALPESDPPSSSVGTPARVQPKSVWVWHDCRLSKKDAAADGLLLAGYVWGRVRAVLDHEGALLARVNFVRCGHHNPERGRNLASPDVWPTAKRTSTAKHCRRY